MRNSPGSGALPAGTLPTPNARPDRPRLDTAAQLGASYADVRVVRRRDESITVKSGRVEGVAMGETDGFGVRVLVDGAWGFAASDTPRARRRRTASARSRSGSRRRRRRRSGARSSWTVDRRPPGPSRRRSTRTRSRSRSSARSRTSSMPTAPPARVKGVTFTESMYSGHREWKTFAATDGSFTEQVITQVGSARRGERDRGRRAPAPELPGRRRRLPGGRLRVRPRPGPRSATPSRSARRPSRCSRAPQCPSGHADDRPRPVDAVPADPRELRPPDPSSTACSAPRRPTRARAS